MTAVDKEGGFDNIKRSIVFEKKEKNCLLGGLCPFLLEYQRILFCVSEILGQECQIERQKLDFVREAQSKGENSQKPAEPPVGTWLPGFC
jgi:hypothetical protein